MKTLRSVAAALIVAAIFSFALSQEMEAVRFPRCQWIPATIVAAPGGAVTNGTSGDDVIYGTNGADVIYGNGGNDLICGNGGNDVIYAFAPDETLSLTACVDSVDLVSYYATSVDPGSGHDIVCGPSSSAGGYWTVLASSGNDTIGYALGVDEDLFGGSGSDTMRGALKYPGNVNSYSVINGGSGSDTLSAGEMFFYPGIDPTPYKVVADGGSGTDVVSGAAVDFLTGLLKGGSGFDTCTMAIGTATPELDFSASCEVKIS